jgi:hypothetical protein
LIAAAILAVARKWRREKVAWTLKQDNPLNLIGPGDRQEEYSSFDPPPRKLAASRDTQS